MRASAGGTYLLRPQTRLTGRIFHTRVRARAEPESGQIYGLGLSAAHSFDTGWQAQINIAYSQERRDGPNPVFDLRRRDLSSRISLLLTNRNVQYRGFSPVLELGSERRQSNIEIFEFRNNFLGLNLTRGF